jgi:ABC-type branched-subunit amino acid transport system ATPase component
MLLAVEELTKLFGGVPAVNHCSLEIGANEITAIIGPNGAGKSTLIDLVAGFQKPTSGRVQFAEHDITHRAPHSVANLGLIRTFQLARVWGRLTVMENLLVAGAGPGRETLWRTFVGMRHLRRAESADRVRARQVLGEFDLLHHKDTRAEALSGGQKRILEFARIVMASPRMVLLDEPSASLSPDMSARVGLGIRHLFDAGITVLLVEHDLSLVESLTERVVVMAFGEVIGAGSLTELRSNSAVVDAYLGSISNNNGR